ncbi:MAG TPA: hypothetical protein VMH01_10165 [Puia sp.]|nr:hypothetical protein [Puia sp.]
MKSIKFGYGRYVPWILSFFSALFFLPPHSLSQQSSTPNAFFTSSKFSTTPLRMNEVRRNAVRHFRANFSNTGNENWFRTDDFYVAVFFDGQMRVKAYYDTKGAFDYCVKYYNAPLLNADIRLAIMKKFESYKIDVVTEVTNLEEQIYFIKIKTNSNIKTLKVVNGSIEVTEDYINIGT